jgi:hypothetical protein
MSYIKRSHYVLFFILRVCPRLTINGHKRRIQSIATNKPKGNEMNKSEQREMSKLAAWASIGEIEMARRGVETLLRSARTQRSIKAITEAAQAAKIL